MDLLKVQIGPQEGLIGAHKCRATVCMATDMDPITLTMPAIQPGNRSVFFVQTGCFFASVLLNAENSVVLDITVLFPVKPTLHRNGHILLKKWTEIFLKANAQCKTISVQCVTSLPYF